MFLLEKLFRKKSTPVVIPVKIRPDYMFENTNKGCFSCSRFNGKSNECQISLKEFEEIIDKEIEKTLYDKVSVREICKNIFDDGKFNKTNLFSWIMYDFSETKANRYFQQMYKNVPECLYTAIEDYLILFCYRYLRPSISSKNYGCDEFYQYCDTLGISVASFVDYKIEEGISKGDKINISMVRYNKNNSCILYTLNKV